MSMNEKFIPMGFQYYRAPTPEQTEWEADLKKLSSDGYNTVKFWIQWRWNEPRRGEYDFSDIDELMRLAEKYALKVVLNIILDVSPVWLTRDYPDSDMISARGERVSGYASEYRQIGGMPGPCFHHAEAAKRKEEFVAACAKRYASHPALLYWDVWNEPELSVGIYREPIVENLLCYCPNSVAAFRDYLKEKYKDIAALNRRWGRRYNDFSEAEPPRRHGTTADMIDWREFFCDTITQEFKKRVETVKKYDRVHPVMCHTVPIPLFNSISCCSDDFSIAEYGDLLGNSVGSDPMAADFLKSAAHGKDIINSEIHACYGNSLNGFRIPDVNDMLRHIFVPLVHGSKGFLFWQYRPELLGNEAPAWGHTTRLGGDTPWDKLTQKFHGIIKDNLDAVSAYAPPRGEVAIYCDKGNEIYTWEATRDTRLFTSSIIGAYNLFYRNNYAVDFIDGKGLLSDLSAYKAVYFPAVFLFDEKKAAAVKKYAEEGGTVIIEALFACENEETGRHEKLIPGCGFSALLDRSAETIYSSTMIENGYDGKVFTSNDGDRVAMSANGKALSGAKYLIAYTDGETPYKPLAFFESGRVAASEHTIGKGRVIDFATLFAYGYHLFGGADNLAFLRKIVGEPAAFSSFPLGLRGDEVLLDDKGFVVVDNTSDESQTFTLPFAPQKIGEIIGDCERVEDKFIIKKKKTALIKII